MCVVVALSLFLASCSNVSEVYRSIEADVAHGEYLHAINTVHLNEQVYGEKARVLYNLDIGLLYHYAAVPDSSTKYFLQAEGEIQDLYTKSISLAAISLLTNDNVLPYEGEDFEKVMINVFLALNYARLGENDEALVEARKVDEKLRDYAVRYAGKNSYQEDALARYLSGVLYESGDEINDAFIAYRKAYEAYQKYDTLYGTPAPRFLLDDLVRTASLMEFTEEAQQYVALGGKPLDAEERNLGTIFIVAYAGRGPIKEQIRPSVTIPDSSGTLHTFQIALPKFVPRMQGVRSYDVEAFNVADSMTAVNAKTELAQDITAIAGRCLDDRMALVYLKSGGRALLKFLAAEKVKSGLKKKDDAVTNFLGSLAVDLAVGATEQADLRSWGTLPAQIQLAKLRVHPGTYALRVHSSDNLFASTATQVTVRRGKTEFIILDDVR